MDVGVCICVHVWCVGVCICVHVWCVGLCICVHVWCVGVCMCVCLVCGCVGVCICVSVLVFMCVYVFRCTGVCVCVCSVTLLSRFSVLSFPSPSVGDTQDVGHTFLMKETEWGRTIDTRSGSNST